MRKSTIISFAPFFLLAMASPLAYSGPITFQFTGSVNSVFSDPGDPFNGGIGFGTPFSGTYTFDVTPNLIGGTTSGSYQISGAPYGLTVNIGGFSFSNYGSLAINTLNSSTDQYGVLACEASCNSGLVIELAFQDSTGTAFAGNALPLTPPITTGFQINSFTLTHDSYLSAYQLEINGNVTSLTAPEPGTLLLVATCLAAAGLRRRR